MANINRYDDLHTGTIAYATLLSCIVLVITILGVRALCSAWVEGEEELKSVNAHYTDSDNAISDQKAQLAGYRTETKEITVSDDSGATSTENKTYIRIPVERAGKLILEELAQNKSS